MENKAKYAKADRDAVRILRRAYSAVEILHMGIRPSDLLYNARQYLQDRERYERIKGEK
jgi:hypothetical protein